MLLCCSERVVTRGRRARRSGREDAQRCWERPEQSNLRLTNAESGGAVHAALLEVVYLTLSLRMLLHRIVCTEINPKVSTEWNSSDANTSESGTSLARKTCKWDTLVCVTIIRTYQ